MPYYSAGDYYQGDNYQGDFLGIGGFIKKAAGTALSVIPGGGIVKGLLTAGSVARSVGARKGVSFGHQVAAGLGFPQGQLRDIATAQIKAAQSPVPGMALMPLPQMAVRPGAQIAVPNYVTQLQQLQGFGRRGRRMNVTNVKALRRAGRRVRGFLKIASRLGALPISRTGKGKLFKRKRR